MNDTTRNDMIGWGVLAALAAVAVYVLILLGGIVRVTGSGMGCGDDWPLCNGQLVPAMDFATAVEFGHRLAALGVSVLVVALAGTACWPRLAKDRRSLRRLGLLAVLLLVIQVLLGAATVWLELPASTVILHFGTALSLLAVLTVSACVGLAGGDRPSVALDGAARTVIGLAAFAFAVAILGALVANLDAGPACLGFPACNGSWFPRGGGLIHVHWTHRLAAYLFFLLLIGLPFMVRRWRSRDGAALVWSGFALFTGAAQVLVAAALVLALFPTGLRVAHQAVGTALFGSLVITAWLVARPRVAS